MPQNGMNLRSNMGYLLPWFLSEAHTSRFTKEYEDWKNSTPEERARDFSMKFGSAFGPAGRAAAEAVASGEKLPESNYWNQVIRNYVKGGGVDDPKKFMAGVSVGPGIHSDINAVSEAAKLYENSPLPYGNPTPEEIGRKMERLYEDRYGRTFHGQGLGDYNRKPGDPQDENEWQDRLRRAAGTAFMRSRGLLGWR